MKRLLGAATLASALLACGDRAQPGSPVVTPQGSPTPMVAVRASPTPAPTGKVDRTIAPPVPPILRVRWMYLSDKATLHLQEDGTPGLLKEARLLASDGRIVASGTSHQPKPGEPRQCGGDYAAVPPVVASLDVGADLSGALRSGTAAYTLEVRDSSRWYRVGLLDWSRIAGGYCVQQ